MGGGLLALTEAGGVGCRVDLESGAADDQVRGQPLSFICGDHRVLLGHVELQLRQVGHFVTYDTTGSLRPTLPVQELAACS